MAVIKASTTDPVNLFNLNGLDYPKGLYKIKYDNIVVGDLSKVRLSIVSTHESFDKLTPFLPVSSYSNGVSNYDNLASLVEDLVDLLGFNIAEQTALKKQGFIDYNDTTGAISLTANTWTDVPNNGLGAFTNKAYRPILVNEVMDTSTGYLDFSELTLGSQLTIRNDFSVTPSTNNALLEVRYLLGQGEGEYPLLFWSERLDNGSGIPYQRVPVFTIYMGDTNTQGGVGKLQMRLSSNGTLNNAGSYINIQLR
jgi:hypothetical protein